MYACNFFSDKDQIYGNRSKSHIGSYKIIDLKISKHYNQPKIVSTRMKLAQKVDYFTVFKSFLSISCCSQKFPPNNLEKSLGWKLIVQWCGYMLVVLV